TLKGNHGEVQISTPRDREGSYNPILVGKRQTRLTEFDDQIISLYARGMSTRDIADAFEDMYGAKVSHSLIAQVTDAVIEQVEAWQSRSLDDIYPIIYLDCIVVRSEEHTSELQSRENLVCRLLLVKKNCHDSPP